MRVQALLWPVYLLYGHLLPGPSERSGWWIRSISRTRVIRIHCLRQRHKRVCGRGGAKCKMIAEKTQVRREGSEKAMERIEHTSPAPLLPVLFGPTPQHTPTLPRSTHTCGGKHLDSPELSGSKRGTRKRNPPQCPDLAWPKRKQSQSVIKTLSNRLNLPSPKLRRHACAGFLGTFASMDGSLVGLALKPVRTNRPFTRLAKETVFNATRVITPLPRMVDSPPSRSVNSPLLQLITYRRL